MNVKSETILGYVGHMQGPQTPKRVILHGTVSGTFVGSAESTAHYFRSPNSGGLAHWVIDPLTIVKCCEELTQCWGDGYNVDEIHIEFCDWVNWDSKNADLLRAYPREGQFHGRWTDDYHQSMLHIGASKVAAICDIYKIPDVWQNVAALTKLPEGEAKGITAHSDISEAWHTSNHMDPGPDFPVGKFMSLVRGYYNERTKH